MSESDDVHYPNLWHRDGKRFYVKMRVPADLRHVDTREHRVVSLRTSDYRTAVSHYKRAIGDIERDFERLRLEAAQEDRTTSALRLGRLDLIDSADLEALARQWFEQRRVLAKAAVGAGGVAAQDERDDLAAELSDADESAETVQHATDRLLVSAGVLARPRRLGARQTAQLFPVIDRKTDQYLYLTRLVRRGLQMQADEARGSTIVFPSAPLREAVPAQVGEAGRTVADLIAAHRTDREARYGKESTDRKYGHIFRVLEEALGKGVLVRTLRREDGRKVREFLKAVPANASKIYPGLSLAAAIAAAEKDDAPRLAPNTVGSYLQNLSAMLNWAVEEEWLEKNPAKGLVEKGKAVTKRRGFRPNELQTVFDGLRVIRDTKPTRYWTSALALFTGARAGEICQLRVSDVVVEDGIQCLDLTEFDASGRRAGDKHLKTPMSDRLVPIHPELISAGFITFVEQARARGAERLFSDLTPGPDGRYSHGHSKWFGYFLDGLGLSDPALVFHSFRHGFRDACRRADIQQETAQALGGWTSENQASRYGDRGMVRVLHRAIEKLEFGGFHLPVAEG